MSIPSTVPDLRTMADAEATSYEGSIFLGADSKQMLRGGKQWFDAQPDATLTDLLAKIQGAKAAQVPVKALPTGIPELLAYEVAREDAVISWLLSSAEARQFANGMKTWIQNLPLADLQSLLAAVQAAKP
jgi:hypothetical protein